MTHTDIRRAAVAGHFYPDSASELRSQVAGFLGQGRDKREVLGCLVPHAGYMYSGAVAGAVFSRIAVPPIVVMFGPNHTGYGSPFSIMSEGMWETPMGRVKIEHRLASELLSASDLLTDDPLAHLREHSLEVELPFLQFLRQDVSIVPCAVASHNLDDLKKLGKLLAETVKRLKLEKQVLILASSDMTHYEPDGQARKKDSKAIEAMLALDPAALVSRVAGMGISMCGFSPAIIMIEAAVGLGAEKAELIEYKTSGDVSGDRSNVVGYAGIVVR